VSWDCSSQFRRSGQRDERRRRLLAEEPPKARKRRRKQATEGDLSELPPHYGDEAMREQPRVTDFVPRASWPYILLMLVGFAAIAGLLLLYDVSTQLGPMTTDGRIAAFDLDGEGSLAVWFSSTTLLAAAVICALVYSVRRHRVDDYHGRYHIWLWAALCWMVLSLDETASLHEGFKNLMVHLTGTPIISGSDGSAWWAVPYFCILGAVGSRLLLDMRPARLSIGAFVASGCCMAVGVAQQMEWILAEAGARGVKLEEGAEMAGFWMLMLAMALHARYVVLDAEGKIPLPRSRPSHEEQQRAIDHERDARLLRLAGGTTDDDDEQFNDEQDDRDQWAAVEPPEPSKRSVLRRRARASRADAAETDDSPADDEPDDASTDSIESNSPVKRKLTKQEKKALRRRLMQEKMQREQQQKRKWAS